MTTAATGPVLLERARSLSDQLLFPNAQDVDRAVRVPAGHLAALAEAGLFGISGPESHGGSAIERGDGWRIFAALVGGCGATTFVWAQHHTVVRVLAASPNDAMRDDLLGDLCAGTTVAGVAFAHVRRQGPPAIAATRIAGGWRLDGFSPWTTSWGIADWFAIAAESDTGDLVWAMIPRDDTAGVTARPLALPVFASTGTVTLTFENCVVPDERIVMIESVEGWRSRDRRLSAVGSPAPLGIIERCVRLIEAVDEPAAAEAAENLAKACVAGGERYEELVHEIVDGRDVVDEASDHRATLIGLAQRSTTALLAAVGGRGMDLGHPAQRLAREADFFVIQAQTADGRAATLRSA